MFGKTAFRTHLTLRRMRRLDLQRRDSYGLIAAIANIILWQRGRIVLQHISNGVCSARPDCVKPSYQTDPLTPYGSLPHSMNSTPDPNHPPVIDHATLLEELGGDADLLKEITGLFLETGPEQLQGVRDAAAAGDANALSRHAHTLKGALAQLHAAAAAAAARDVEEPARHGQAAAAIAAVPKLEAEFSAVQRALEALLRKA